MLDELRRHAPTTVVVIEDVHWADEATLDLLKFLGRRIHRTPALLVISYRDDEVGPTHPLRVVLGHLPMTNVRRLHLAPLSSQAVDALAREAGAVGARSVDVTGGNPFFVTEVLAADRDTVPVTVRDAVMARAAGLSDGGARRLEPRRGGAHAHRALARRRATRPHPASVIEECRAIGMVQSDDGTLAFRHELARRAIEDALPEERRRALHANCLAALLRRGDGVASSARLVHHADIAGDDAALVRHGPIAAAHAASVGAHREAAALYARTLRVAGVLPMRERALLLEQYSVECYLSEPIDAACSARAEALAIWRALGDRLREGDALRWLSRLWWIRGVGADAERFATEALSVLEALPPGRELAMAYSNRSQLAMLAADVDGSVDWGTRAIAIAEPLGDMECVVNTLISVGTAEHTADRPGGMEKLERSLALALEHRYPECVVRAYTNITTNSSKKCEYDRAEVYLRDGLAYCEERDMVLWSLYLLAWRAHVQFERGNWARAEEDATAVLAQAHAAAISRIHALVVLARVRTHRGEAGWEALLDEARDLATSTGEPQRIWPVACARAEAAWLLGDVDRTANEAAIDWSMTNDVHVQCEDRSRHTRHAMWDRRGIRWEVGQLALWLWRANRLPPIQTSLSLAVERQIAGDWRAAADEWKRLGSPLQQAMALADADDEHALRRRWSCSRSSDQWQVARTCVAGCARWGFAESRAASARRPGATPRD